MIPAALLVCALAFSQEPARVEKGDIQQKIPVSGTAASDGVFRLKSAGEARVEQVLVSTNSWAEDGKVLGTLANKELMAMLDAAGNAQQAENMLAGRSQRLYQPTKISCPKRCFVLRTFIKPKQMVRPQAVLIEAAHGLRLVVHVPVADAGKVDRGQVFEFWPAGRPEKKLSSKIPGYDLDWWGKRGEPGGSFELELTPEFYLDPGTAWEGLIYADVKKGVPVVPNRALIRHEGMFYLPVAVSTGVMNEEKTEVFGVAEGRPILILGDLQLGSAQRAKPQPAAAPDSAPKAPAAKPAPEPTAEEPGLAPPSGE